jgi:hypothetical protein
MHNTASVLVWTTVTAALCITLVQPCVSVHAHQLRSTPQAATLTGPGHSSWSGAAPWGPTSSHTAVEPHRRDAARRLLQTATKLATSGGSGCLSVPNSGSGFEFQHPISAAPTPLQLFGCLNAASATLPIPGDTSVIRFAEDTSFCVGVFNGTVEDGATVQVGCWQRGLWGGGGRAGRPLLRLCALMCVLCKWCPNMVPGRGNARQLCSSWAAHLCSHRRALLGQLDGHAGYMCLQLNTQTSDAIQALQMRHTECFDRWCSSPVILLLCLLLLLPVKPLHQCRLRQLVCGSTWENSATDSPQPGDYPGV